MTESGLSIAFFNVREYLITMVCWPKDGREPAQFSRDSPTSLVQMSSMWACTIYDVAQLWFLTVFGALQTSVTSSVKLYSSISCISMLCISIQRKHVSNVSKTACPGPCSVQSKSKCPAGAVLDTVSTSCEIANSHRLYLKDRCRLLVWKVKPVTYMWFHRDRSEVPIHFIFKHEILVQHYCFSSNSKHCQRLNFIILKYDQSVYLKIFS